MTMPTQAIVASAIEIAKMTPAIVLAPVASTALRLRDIITQQVPGHGERRTDGTEPQDGGVVRRRAHDRAGHDGGNGGGRPDGNLRTDRLGDLAARGRLHSRVPDRRDARPLSPGGFPGGGRGGVLRLFRPAAVLLRWRGPLGAGWVLWRDIRAAVAPPPLAGPAGTRRRDRLRPGGAGADEPGGAPGGRRPGRSRQGDRGHGQHHRLAHLRRRAPALRPRPWNLGGAATAAVTSAVLRPAPAMRDSALGSEGSSR